MSYSSLSSLLHPTSTVPSPINNLPTSTPIPLVLPANASTPITLTSSSQTTPKYLIVIKIGSSSLSSDNSKYPNISNISNLIELICNLKSVGHSIILVTSGAVAIGCQRMQVEKPKEIIKKQAIAAIGQGRLIRLYDDLFSLLNQPIAQVLLTRENLADMPHYNNAYNTFKELLNLGVVPIVNENDTVAVEELKVGDNDTLSALVASLVDADYLFLLTDVDALYTMDPKHPDAKPINIVEKIEDVEHVVCNTSGSWGTGGMATKIQAAKIATKAGIRTVITRSNKPENIIKILNGELIGTQFIPQERPIKGKKKWIAHGVRMSGSIYLDEGATKAVTNHSSLFAAGILKVDGNFGAQAAVSVYDNLNKEIARGLSSYSSDELNKIKGKTSKEFESILGYVSNEEVISRLNLVLL